MRSTLCILAAGLGCFLSSNLAHAHITASATNAYASSTIEANFNVGHGCAGLDTFSVKITIPSGVTGVRVVENGSFESAVSTQDASGNVTTVTFTKAQSAVRAADDAFYKLVLRLKLPNTPFGVVRFPTTQVCKSADGNTTQSTDWVADTETENGPEPAPSLLVLPARVPGWNKYTAALDIPQEQLATLFKDALIVWAGAAAYSVNPTTAAQIATEDGVDALDAISAGAELWVKY